MKISEVGLEQLKFRCLSDCLRARTPEKLYRQEYFEVIGMAVQGLRN